jgi:hypothetical protein
MSRAITVGAGLDSTRVGSERADESLHKCSDQAGVGDFDV